MSTSCAALQLALTSNTALWETHAAPRRRAAGLALRRVRAGDASASSVDVERRCGALHNFPGDHHLLDAFEARQVEHGVEQDALPDRAQPPRAGLAVDRLAGDGAERFLR